MKSHSVEIQVPNDILSEKENQLENIFKRSKKIFIQDLNVKLNLLNSHRDQWTL